MLGHSTQGSLADTAGKRFLTKSHLGLRDSIVLSYDAERSADIVPSTLDRHEDAVKKPYMPLLKLGGYETLDVSYQSEVDKGPDDYKRQFEEEAKRCKLLENTVKNLKKELKSLSQAKEDCQALNFHLKGMYEELQHESQGKAALKPIDAHGQSRYAQQDLQLDQLTLELSQKYRRVAELELNVVELERRNIETEQRYRLEAKELLGENSLLRGKLDLKDKELVMLQKKLDSVDAKCTRHDDRFIELSRINAEKKYAADKAKAELEDFKAKYNSLLKDKDVEEKRLRNDLETQRHFSTQLSAKLKELHPNAEKLQDLQNKLREMTVKCGKLELLHDEQLAYNQRSHETKENRTRKTTPIRATPVKSPIRARPRASSKQRRGRSVDLDGSISTEGFSEAMKRSTAVYSGYSSRCNSCLGILRKKYI